VGNLLGAGGGDRHKLYEKEKDKVNELNKNLQNPNGLV
jgi:hypothetical protein